MTTTREWFWKLTFSTYVVILYHSSQKQHIRDPISARDYYCISSGSICWCNSSVHLYRSQTQVTTIVTTMFCTICNAKANEITIAGDGSKPGWPLGKKRFYEDLVGHLRRIQWHQPCWSRPSESLLLATRLDDSLPSISEIVRSWWCAFLSLRLSLVPHIIL